jgi:hypothetical protein
MFEYSLSDELQPVKLKGNSALFPVICGFELVEHVFSIRKEKSTGE